MSFTSCVTVVSAERERGEKLRDVELGERVTEADRVDLRDDHYAWLNRDRETCRDWSTEYAIIEQQQTRHPHWFFFALGMAAAGAGAAMTYHGVVNKKDGEDIPATLAIGPIVLGGGALAAVFYLFKDEYDSRRVTLDGVEREPHTSCTSKPVTAHGVSWKLSALGHERDFDVPYLNLKSAAAELLAYAPLTQETARELASGFKYTVEIGNARQSGTLTLSTLGDAVDQWGTKQSATLNTELSLRWDACSAFGVRGRDRLECFGAAKGKLSRLYETNSSFSVVKFEDTELAGTLREFKIDQSGEFELLIARTGKKPWMLRLVNEETGEVAVSKLLGPEPRQRFTGKMTQSGDWALAVVAPFSAGELSATIVFPQRGVSARPADAPLVEEVVRR